MNPRASGARIHRIYMRSWVSLAHGRTINYTTAYGKQHAYLRSWHVATH